MAVLVMISFVALSHIALRSMCLISYMGGIFTVVCYYNS